MLQDQLVVKRIYKEFIGHCGQSITAFSVRLMFATVRLLKESYVSPFIAQKRLLLVIFKPLQSSVSFMDM